MPANIAGTVAPAVRGNVSPRRAAHPQLDWFFFAADLSKPYGEGVSQSA
jgi:hypothetical protein